jgi:hypothetical protein
MADLNQALPTQYSGLGDLWDRAPALAALQTGDQMRWAQQNNSSLQDAFSNQEAFKQQQRPLELDKLRADTGLVNAHAGYFGAETGKVNQATGELKQTQTGRVNATNAENAEKVDKAQIAHVEGLGQRMRLAAGIAASEPNPQVRVQKVMKALGDDFSQNPEFQQFLTQHANNLHVYLQDYGDAIYKQTDAFRKAQAKEEAEMARTQEQTRSAEKVAQMNIDAGRWKRNGPRVLTMEQNIDKEGDPVKKYTMLVEAAQEAMNAGNQEEAAHYGAQGNGNQGNC